MFALSSGMRARLQLARAILHSPSVLILDEPTGAIDPVAAHELLGLIISIVEEERLACMISSHRLEEIEALHSHVVLLDKGRIRYDGDLDELRALVDREQLEIEFKTDESARQARKLIDAAGLGESFAVEGSQLTTVLTSSETTTGDVLAVLETVVPDVLHLQEVQRPLRDILADMYREHEAT